MICYHIFTLKCSSYSCHTITKYFVPNFVNKCLNGRQKGPPNQDHLGQFFVLETAKTVHCLSLQGEDESEAGNRIRLSHSLLFVWVQASWKKLYLQLIFFMAIVPFKPRHRWLKEGSSVVKDNVFPFNKLHSPLLSYILRTFSTTWQSQCFPFHLIGFPRRKRKLFFLPKVQEQQGVKVTQLASAAFCIKRGFSVTEGNIIEPIKHYLLYQLLCVTNGRANSYEHLYRLYALDSGGK